MRNRYATIDRPPKWRDSVRISISSTGYGEVTNLFWCLVQEDHRFMSKKIVLTSFVQQKKVLTTTRNCIIYKKRLSVK